MHELLIIVGVALFSPILFLFVINFGAPAVACFHRAISDTNLSFAAKAVLFIQAIMWGGASVIFLTGPIANSGIPGLIGMIIGWYLIKRVKHI